MQSELYCAPSITDFDCCLGMINIFVCFFNCGIWIVMQQKMKIEVDSLGVFSSDGKCQIQRKFEPNLICNGLHNWNIIGKSVPLRYSTEPELDISIFAPISHNRNLSLAPPSSYIAKHLTSFEQISFASQIEWTSLTYGKHQVLLV